MSGGQVLINASPVVMRSLMQFFVTLSAAEAEGTCGVTMAQEMFHVYLTLTSVNLEGMVLEMDNQGVVHMANNWSVGENLSMLMCKIVSCRN